ncbi:hypothetical protein HYH03_015463 [Edaphochlamys debaryana]|uniref:AAA+ ATPase domain-containing protein n=1 Tax=Edaphochlamys debaryana TaxID=47281 RepID=A0A835XLY6_9CHLO|nr:hypothetical protein HYH03_015463 [Edaphochlamys debaryana]|eukprot:KAG2485880.1 hypothetical protein HYH03_015463 [Edaphochlamys debaryana]
MNRHGRPLQAGSRLLLELAAAREALLAAVPLRPPGDAVARLAWQVLAATDAALANRANLAALCRRAAALVQLMAACGQELGVQRYRRLAGDAQDVLEALLAYARSYGSLDCIVRQLTSPTMFDDSAWYEELYGTLRDLTHQLSRAGPAAAAKVEAAAQAAAASTPHQYEDTAAAARALASELGGLAALLEPAGGGGGGAALRELVACLDVRRRRTEGQRAGAEAPEADQRTQAAEVEESLVELVAALLASHADPGPQRLIRNPELRLLWRQAFGRGTPSLTAPPLPAGAAGTAAAADADGITAASREGGTAACDVSQVPWAAWWGALPRLLRRMAAHWPLLGPGEAGRLEACAQQLQGPEGQRAFCHAVKGGTPLGETLTLEAAGPSLGTDNGHGAHGSGAGSGARAGGVAAESLSVWELGACFTAAPLLPQLEAVLAQPIDTVPVSIARGLATPCDPLKAANQARSAPCSASAPGPAAHTAPVAPCGRGAGHVWPRSHRPRAGLVGPGAAREPGPDRDARVWTQAARCWGGGGGHWEGLRDWAWHSAVLRGTPSLLSHAPDPLALASVLDGCGPSLRLLLGPSGVGKTRLAAACLAAPCSGSALVDLRGAGSAAEVEARFCVALGVTPCSASADSQVAVLLALSRRVVACRADQPPHLVVRGAEHALARPDTAAALRSLIRRVLLEGPEGLQVVVPSTVPLRLAPSEVLGAQVQVEHVRPPSARAAAQMARDAAPGLTAAEAEALAEAGGRVPLALMVAAAAMEAGRLTVEDLAELRETLAAQDAATPTTSGPVVADPATALVRLALSRLKRPHLEAAAQLAVFPCAFGEEGAAVLLGLASAAEAQGLLTALVRHRVIERLSQQPYGAQLYDMHGMVRQAAVRICTTSYGTARLTARAQGRFVAYMVGRVRKWVSWYGRSSEWRLALAAAREGLPDLAEALRLLPYVYAGAAGTIGEDDGGGGAPAAASSVQGLASLPAEDLCGLMEAVGLLDELRAACEGLHEHLGPSHTPTPLSGSTTPSPTSAQAAEADARYKGPEGTRPSASADNSEPAVTSAAEAARELALAGVLCVLGWVRHRTACCAACTAPAAAAAAAEPEARLHALAEAEAEALYRSAWALRSRLLGPADPRTAACLAALGQCFSAQDRCTEARELLARLLEPSAVEGTASGAIGQGAGGSHGSRAETSEAGGAAEGAGSPSCKSGAGSITCASALPLAGSPSNEHAPTNQSPAVDARVSAAALACLASCAAKQGHHREAVSLSAHATDQLRALLGAGAAWHCARPIVARLSGLATTLGQHGKTREAEALWRGLLSLAQLPGASGAGREADAACLSAGLAVCASRQGDTERWRLIGTAADLCTHLLDEAGPTADTPALARALASCFAVQGRSVLTWTAGKAGDLALWGSFEQAKTVYRRAYLLSRALHGDGHRSTVDARQAHQLAAAVAVWPRWWAAAWQEAPEPRGLLQAVGAPPPPPAARTGIGRLFGRLLVRRVDELGERGQQGQGLEAVLEPESLLGGLAVCVGLLDPPDRARPALG